MTEFLRAWIINITVIIVFIMFLDTIMPNSSLKRYINVVVGLLVIVTVIKPFVLVREYAESFSSEFLETMNFVEQSGNVTDSERISKYQQYQAVEIFESNLKDQITKLVENNVGREYEGVLVELDLEKDMDKKDFGSIKSVRVSLRKEGKEVIEVDKININISEGTGENKNVINKDKVEYNLNDSKISKEIKDVISKALGISESVVSIDVQQ